MRDTTRMNNTEKLAVSIREAAAMLGISPRSVQNFVSLKKLPARKIGRRTLVLMRDLEAFLRRDHVSPRIAVREDRPQVS